MGTIQKGTNFNIFDLFIEDIEYPNHDVILNGLQDGQVFSYISKTYLNGLINYVDIIGAFMINRYSQFNEDEDEWEKRCKNVDSLIDEYHTYLGDSDRFDDILILAKGADSYWLFWKDCDGSDCEIGRLPKSLFESKEVALRYLKESLLILIENCSPNNILREEVKANPKAYIKELTPSHFNGWITL
jgi:hypothetical protein